VPPKIGNDFSADRCCGDAASASIFVASQRWNGGDTAGCIGTPSVKSQQDLVNRSVIPLTQLTFGMPPAQYRRQGTHARFRPGQPGGDQMVMQEVVIRNVPAMDVLTIDHVGPYMQISKAFDAMMGWLGARDLLSSTVRMIGIFYDDPAVVPEGELRSKAGVVLSKKVDVSAPVSITQLRGGEYAVLRYKGPYADLDAAYKWLYGEWLLKSGREAADAPAFEEYLNTPQDTAPSDLLTEIHLPLV
jgi:AraC family transcriptional regulator